MIRGQLSWYIVWSLILAVVFEGITCLFRFGLRLESTRDTKAIGHLTFGLRIHHGYIGLVALIVCLFIKESLTRDIVIVVANALVLSDLAHHFLVLWPITGSPHFDFFYDD
jgi:hypothetical protein